MKAAFEDVKDFFIIKKKKRIAAVFERLKRRFTKDWSKVTYSSWVSEILFLKVC